MNVSDEQIKKSADYEEPLEEQGEADWSAETPSDERLGPEVRKRLGLEGDEQIKKSADYEESLE